uniref:LemA protein n=1 Tax=Candidatus Kentrum sp. LPFa TaxID=2126335 RepID=A0A450WQZ6_9GAMM|nr:MAG: hypothetical protein BECKLPF1236B_GA0070989_11738 [Candidatus Kentron sp. LPFa]
MQSKTGYAWEVLGIWVAAFAAVVSACGVGVVYWNITEENDWNKRIEAARIIKQLDDDLRERRDDINKHFPALFSGQLSAPLSKDNARNLFFSCKQDDKQDRKDSARCEARKTAGDVLNSFEDLSISYMYELGDREMLAEAWSHELTRYFMYFENFIKTVRLEHKDPKLWISIDSAVAKMGKS